MNENENINQEIVNPDEVVDAQPQEQQPPVPEEKEEKDVVDKEPTADTEEVVEEEHQVEEKEKDKAPEVGQEETPQEEQPQEPVQTEEQQQEQQQKQQEVEVQEPDEVDERIKEIEELRQKVKDFEDEKEIRTQVEEFAKVKNAKEREFDTFMATLGENYINTLKKYGIDTTKTIEEIAQDDPAKGEIAMKITEQAEQIKRQKAREIADTVDNEYHKIVFTKAEKEFAKFNLTHEQQKAAADNFVNIVLQLGVQDLGNDVTEKVKFAVGRAIMEHPKEAEKIAPATAEEIAQAVEEKVAAPQTEEVEKEEKQEEKKNAETEKEEKETVEKEETPVIPIDEFREGIISAGTGVETLSEENILEVLAKVPFKERTAFYMKHYDIIERAAAKTKLKPNNIG